MRRREGTDADRVSVSINVVHDEVVRRDSRAVGGPQWVREVAQARGYAVPDCWSPSLTTAQARELIEAIVTEIAAGERRERERQERAAADFDRTVGGTYILDSEWRALGIGKGAIGHPLPTVVEVERPGREPGPLAAAADKKVSDTNAGKYDLRP
jgi:hypothetical protein